MLHTPHYDVRGNPYCGPTAISAVTGLPISLIVQTVREVRGTVKKNGAAMPVIGLHNHELLAVMERLGWRVTMQMPSPVVRSGWKGWELPHKPYRLRDFLDYCQMHEGSFIVNVTRHYIAASEGEVCDNWTKLPIPIPRWKTRLGRHVKCWWRFEN